MTDITRYFGEPNTNLVVIDRTDLANDKTPHFKIIYGDENTTTTIEFNWNDLEKGLKSYIYFQRNESLLIEAVRNFVRKINFNELNEALKDEEITEEQYEKELESNSDKYAITLRNANSPNDIIHIANLVSRIGFDLRDFSTSEVAEMFSIKESQLVSYINTISKQIK